MKVYVVINEWQSPDEHSTELIGIFDSEEKAQVAVTEAYSSDLEWVTDKGYELTDLETNELTPNRSGIITKDWDYWSDNYIKAEVVL